MAVAFVVPSLLPKDEQFHIKGVVDPEVVKRMIGAYRDKLIAVGPKTLGLPPAQRIDTTKEYLGLVLEREAVELVLKQDGCGDLIALFSVEGGTNKNTVILMGLDKTQEQNLLRDASGRFGMAEETWPPKLPVSNETEFNKFFDIHPIAPDA